MAKTAEQRLVSTVGQIVDFHGRLDDAEWVLSRKMPMIRRILSRYKKGLRVAFGSYLQSPSLDQDLNGAIDTFFGRMKRFIESGRLKERQVNREKILAQTKDEMLKQFGGISDTMVNRQLQKTRNFKIQKDLAEIPKAQLAQISEKINTVRIEGETFNKKQLDNVWETLQGKYGENGQVIFDSGQKRNLRAYVDGRTRTTANDLHRSGTVLSAAATGTVFGRVSSHSAKDSCVLHEKELVFMTPALKAKFIRENPDFASQVSGFQTVQDLEADSTHIFKFNCKHIILAEGVQFFGKAAMKRNFDENVVNKVGNKKLSETRIEKAVLAGELEAGQKVDLDVLTPGGKGPQRKIPVKIAEKPKIKPAPKAPEKPLAKKKIPTAKPKEDVFAKVIREAKEAEDARMGSIGGRKLEKAHLDVFDKEDAYNETISRDVKNSVKAYTREGTAQGTNRFLRDGSVDIEGTFFTSEKELKTAMNSQIKNIDTYLEGGPKLKGDVFRGMHFENKKQLTSFVDSVRGSGQFSMKNYASSSGLSDRALEFGHGGVIMRIRSKSSVAIAGLSKFPSEAEFLFPRNTAFTVKSIRTESLGVSKLNDKTKRFEDIFKDTVIIDLEEV